MSSTKKSREYIELIRSVVVSDYGTEALWFLRNLELLVHFECAPSAFFPSHLAPTLQECISSAPVPSQIASVLSRPFLQQRTGVHIHVAVL